MPACLGTTGLWAQSRRQGLAPDARGRERCKGKGSSTCNRRGWRFDLQPRLRVVALPEANAAAGGLA